MLPEPQEAIRERIAADAEQVNAIWFDHGTGEWRDFSWRVRHPEQFGDE